MITNFIFEGAFDSYRKSDPNAPMKMAKNALKNSARSAMLFKIKPRIDRLVTVSLDEFYEVYAKDKPVFDLTIEDKGHIKSYPCGWDAQKGLLPVYRLVNEGNTLILVFLCNTRESIIISNYVSWFGWIRSLRRTLKKALIDNPVLEDGDYDFFPYTDIDVKIELNPEKMDANGEFPISFFSFPHASGIEDVENLFSHFYGGEPRFVIDRWVFFSSFHHDNDYQSLAKYKHVFHVTGSVSIDIQYNNRVTFEDFSFLNGIVDRGVELYFQFSLVRYNDDPQSIENLNSILRSEYDRFESYDELKAVIKDIESKTYWRRGDNRKEIIISKLWGEKECKLSIEN